MRWPWSKPAPEPEVIEPCTSKADTDTRRHQWRFMGGGSLWRCDRCGRVEQHYFQVRP